MAIDVNKYRSITHPVKPTDTARAADVPAPSRALFSTSAYTQVEGQPLPAGVALPGLSQDDAARAMAALGNLTDDQKQRLSAARRTLAEALSREVAQAPPALAPADGSDQAAGADGDSDGDSPDWSSALSGPAPQAASVPSAAAPAAVTGASTIGGSQVSVAAPKTYSDNPGAAAATANAVNVYMDTTGATGVSDGDYDRNINAVTFGVMQDLQGQLGDFAQTMSGTNKTKEDVRQQKAALTDAIANWPAGAKTQNFTWTELDSNGRATTRSGALTQEQATAQASNLSDVSDSLNSTSQEQQIKLQNLTQNYQQISTLMTNLLKFEFDTVKSIVGNLRTS